MLATSKMHASKARVHSTYTRRSVEHAVVHSCGFRCLWGEMMDGCMAAR